MTEFTPADAAIDVTVCIVNWNGVQFLRECLQSLSDLSFPSVETIVVDNSSEDNSQEMVRREFPAVALIANETNVGFALANNQAIRRGRGRLFLILNNDTVVAPDCLPVLIRFLEEHPKAGMVTGKLIYPDGRTQFQYYPMILPTPTLFVADLLLLDKIWPGNPWGRIAAARHWDVQKACQMDQISGAFMLIRREALQKVGEFDEGYPFYFEDVDLCARFKCLGWELWYVPDAKIVHHGAASSRLQAYSVQSTRRFKGLLRYARKFFRPSQLFLIRATVATVLVLRLPIVLGAGLWPRERVRQRWKGMWRAYCRLLAELIHS